MGRHKIIKMAAAVWPRSPELDQKKDLHDFRKWLNSDEGRLFKKNMRRTKPIRATLAKEMPSG